MQCSTCGSSSLESDQSSGNTYCVKCGTVCEQNVIVSEVTFGEASTGAAIVQGSLISQDQTHARTFGPYRKHNQLESREMTISNGRKRIAALARTLRLTDRHVEAAVRYFTLAINHNFIKGRRSQYVVASCLYVECRMAKTSHMLIDFSDVLQINVFKLGSTFLKLCRVLRITLPLLDPSIYIGRFAAMLEFGSETQRVASDATRLVSRMNRDWMQIGRRPAGICGACLLIAARMNNFRRSVREVVHVVKVADATIQKRLEEFRDTESGELSVADFRNIWLEGQRDPPSFLRNQKLRQDSVPTTPSSAYSEFSTPVKTSSSQQQQQQQGRRASISSLKQADEGTTEIAKMKTESQSQQSMDLKAKAAGLQAEQDLIEDMSSVLKSGEVKEATKAMAREHQQDDAEAFDFNDEEIDKFLLSSNEVEAKTRVWMELNKDYLADQERKRLKAEEDLKRGIVRQPRKRRKYKPRDSSTEGVASTAIESAKEMMQQRTFSKKINYEALDHLFND
ncbi:transcription factor TFIIIB complex subunit brf1 [Schizosaccharomyces japonicus yFS275]|uniref:B-related factor 1 n=1 Tax=Schizosaccharomyces japonicus (strain yFS275 / FY16936) TaxID=402676 RepID=B6K3D6_SCHJY|nr:transcription factor TFIIIB complex subunit brf1 [Schizosaccharomyces japonicus yFS275]EEB07993.1 transcription factor TFIIIB complex subunit brf1 [Schizosaccharomyces japonicus yFS275]